ncbi:type VI secretion system accessory protein TagJ [Acidisphaera sp. L21]|jgi:type VI secretion system protein ImpE|uniref:type VI secretion system accessory protein TagJ n=1 Tax=Acidisphaera sp. L21 TaxID=1641851 RepID=UPI00131B5959|nr:type VI secretion system accessory protein TagJ [Acidisphaera sp. L21]
MSQTKPDDAGSLFREGRLTDAVAAANAAVRKAPSDLGARLLLAELLVFSGNLERADVILDACGDLDPSVAVVIAEFRQLVRGEVARRQVFRDGRVPEFVGDPTVAQRAALAAILALKSGNLAEAGQHAALLEAERLHPTGIGPTGPFDDLRDGDDLLAGSFEVITTTGKYFWIPSERVTLLEFHPPKRPRDLYWRRATMEVSAGPDGEVYLPAIYAAGTDPINDEFRLGRATDWRQAGEGAPVRGVGAVTFMIGDEAATLMELTSLSFTVLD